MKKKKYDILSINTGSGSSYTLSKYPTKDGAYFEVLSSNSNAFRDINFVLPKDLRIDKVLHISGIACSNCEIIQTGKDTYSIGPIDREKEMTQTEMKTPVPTTPISKVNILDKEHVKEAIKNGILVFDDEAYKTFNIEPFDVTA